MCELQEMFHHTTHHRLSTMVQTGLLGARKWRGSRASAQVLPGPQVRQANQLDEVDPYLTKKYKKEHEEAERVVRPESLVDGSVPTKEGTGSEDQKPKDGEAKGCSIGCVTCEPGQARKQV